jgi:hypothetical protein
MRQNRCSRSPEYALLKGIPNELLINTHEHKKLYAKSAFEKKHNKKG